MVSMPHLAQMGWTYRDELQTADLGGGGKAYFVYDANGQRARKVWEKSSSLSEERIYLGGFEIFRRRTGGKLTLERQTLHVMDDKRTVALVETKTVDTSTPRTTANPLPRYQLDNHLGSSVLELDGTGAVISYEEYYPYGGTSYQAVRSGVEVSAKRYRYTGKERDEETGLYYHGTRYYAPWLGRWTSCDPIGVQGGLNLYAFGRNNPICFTDPAGKQPQDVDDVIPKGSRDYNQSQLRAPRGTNWTKERRAQTAQSRRLKGHGLNGKVYQEHHTADIKGAREVGLHPDIVGEPERLITAHSRRDPSIFGTIGDTPQGKRYTHHYTMERVGTEVQGRLPKTPEGRIDSSAEVKWRARGTPAIANDKLPLRDPGTGEIKQVPKQVNPLPWSEARIVKEQLSLEEAAKASRVQTTGLRNVISEGLPAAKSEIQWGEALGVGARGLKLLGQVATLIGASGVGTRVNQETGNAGWAIIATVVAVPAGAVDDELLMSPIGGEVLKSWDTYNYGPTQGAVGEAIIDVDRALRKVDRWLGF